MNKKMLKKNELEKISAGSSWKKFNRALDYTSAGIEAAAGIATFSLIISSNFDKKGKGFKGIINAIKLAPFSLVTLMLPAHGIWRIASRKFSLYDN